MGLEGTRTYDRALADLYEQKRWWLGLTLGDVFDKNVDLYPHREALVDGDRRYTYAGLQQAVDTLAYELLRRGMKRGDRVLLQLPNRAEFVISYLALQKAGLVMVLLTVNHTAREITHLAGLAGARAWILPRQYRGTDYLPTVRGIREAGSSLEQIIFLGEDIEPDWVDFRDLLTTSAGPAELRRALDAARPDPRDVCFLLPSGGTTNLPKCAVRTHNDYLCNVEYKSRAWDLTATDVSLVATTVGHNLALLVGLSGAIFHGAKVVLIDSTYPKDACEAIEREKVTCAAFVPTMISRLVNYDDLARHDLSSLRRVYVGAANSPPDLVERVEERIGCRYVNAFGMVEGPCSQTRPEDPFEVRTQTIGRPVCPYDDFQILDGDGGRCPRGVEGELAARGPGVFSGYYKNSQANQTAFTPEGYFRTGDLAVIDPRGNIRITGRIKDIIIRGGENIAARDVEDSISSLPSVEYVAAVGMPDPDLGERVCVFVQPVGGQTVDRAQVAAHMQRAGAAKAWIPDRVEVVGSIPLTAAGKADKKVLKQRIAELLGAGN
ncbi:MAG: (2,3-dihydroxybenzoyl)adenylate synthase [Deferrisomatales bacterium]